MTRRRSKGVLVDSGAWIGLMSSRDQHHREADRLLRAALNQRLPLVATNLIVAEAQRLLLHRVGAPASQRFLERLDASSSLEILFATRAHHKLARRWLDRLGDQRITYTDAVSFAVLESSHLEVLTFDSDFAVAGFTRYSG